MRRGVQWMGLRSKIAATMESHRAAKPIWSKASCATGIRGAAWAMARTCSAKQIAHAKVRTSPGLRVEAMEVQVVKRGAAGPRASRAVPTKAMTAPAQVFQRG